MSEQEEKFEYDEDIAVEFIHNHIPQDLKLTFEKDTIYYILDLICEFYEKNDYLNDDDQEKEEKELINFIVQQSQKDDIGKFSSDDVLMLLRAEEAYMDTLEIE